MLERSILISDSTPELSHTFGPILISTSQLGSSRTSSCANRSRGHREKTEMTPGQNEIQRIRLINSAGNAEHPISVSLEKMIRQLTQLALVVELGSGNHVIKENSLHDRQAQVADVLAGVNVAGDDAVPAKFHGAGSNQKPKSLTIVADRKILP